MDWHYHYYIERYNLETQVLSKPFQEFNPLACNPGRNVNSSRSVS